MAAAVYTAFAVYLYRPYFKGFNALQLQDLFVANICLAFLGYYVLSRRWIAGFAESVFAGVIYGFGPFALGLAKFHPTAGFLVATIPWLFCPAVFGVARPSWPLRGRPGLVLYEGGMPSPRYCSMQQWHSTSFSAQDLSSIRFSNAYCVQISRDTHHEKVSRSTCPR